MEAIDEGALVLIKAGLLLTLLAPIVRADLADQRIPNIWNLALGVGGLTVGLAIHPGIQTLLMGLAAASLTGALFVLVLGILRAFKRPGKLGLGDVKFLMAASLWVGFLGASWTFVLASVLVLVWSIARAPWQGLDLTRPLPFAPALATSLIAVLVLGHLF